MVLSIHVRVDLEVMAMKVYCTLLPAAGVETHYQKHFFLILITPNDR